MCSSDLKDRGELMQGKATESYTVTTPNKCRVAKSKNKYMRRYYIPEHAIDKAIAYVKKNTNRDSYPIQEINGMTGELIRIIERKRKIERLKVSFFCANGCSSGLAFERVI